jgi:hypothetical protein
MMSMAAPERRETAYDTAGRVRRIGTGAQAQGRVRDAAAQDQHETEHGELGGDWPAAVGIGELRQRRQEDQQPPWGSARCTVDGS